MEKMKTLTVGGVTFDIVDDGAVRFTEQTLTDEQKAQARENIGVTNGVSSWNDLTDRPFYEEVGEPEIFNGENLAFSDTGSGLFLWQIYPTSFSIKAGNNYLIVWDGVGYYCTAVAANFNGVDGLGLGNFALAGVGEATTEPFLLGVADDGSFAACFTTDNKETHGMIIYNLSPTIKTLDAKYLPVAVSVDLSAYESDGRIVETYADGSVVTTVMEFDENGKPKKITDSNGNVTALTW